MKKTLLSLITLISIGALHAQDKIKDGSISSSAANPATGAILELESNSKALLLPRVSLTQTTTWGLDGTAPTTGGYTVYNLNKSIATVSTDYPILSAGVGVYYWDGSGWVAVKYSSPSTYVEPWKVQTTTVNSTSNTENIYQKGSVVVNGAKPYNTSRSNLLFTVYGAARIGNDPKDTSVSTGDRSLAVGDQSIASGPNSLSVGGYGNGDNTIPNVASGSNTVAFGEGNNVSSRGSFAVGDRNNVSSGWFSQALGSQLVVTGSESTAMGVKDTASGNYSIATGNQTKASGVASFSAGLQSKAFGDYSFAYGNATYAYGAYSLAFGNQATASFNHSVSLGIGTVAPVRSGVALGRYNRYTTSNYTAGTNDNNTIGDPIFQVGQGSDNGTRANIITGYYGMQSSGAFQNGWVVIGANPSNAESVRVSGSNALLTVYGDIKSTGTIYAGTSSMADYVFEDYLNGKSVLKPSYKFTSLKQVESYIRENGHLPGVTSAKEMEDQSNGGYNIDLGKLSVQTLEKTEELYLHVIEQQKTIDSQNVKIASQDKTISDLQKSLNTLTERLNKLENSK